MIDELSTLVSQNLHVDPAGLRFTKFCQRIVQPHTKVLYFVTHKGTPVCIMKTVRELRFNNNLEREMRLQCLAKPVGRIFVPKVLFSGSLGERFVYAEEIIDGLPPSVSELQAYTTDLGTFFKSLPHEGSIRARELYEVLSRYAPQGDAVLAAYLATLRNSDAVFERGLTHGDPGRPNLLRSGDRLYLIDWERAGDIPLWGIDTAGFAKNDDILFAAHMVYTILYRKYPAQYRSLTQEFRF